MTRAGNMPYNGTGWIDTEDIPHLYRDGAAVKGESRGQMLSCYTNRDR